MGSAGSRHAGVSLPPSRAFVVQFGEATAPSEGTFVGRIEHIDSGRSTRFASLQELTGFVAEVLAVVED